MVMIMVMMIMVVLMRTGMDVDNSTPVPARPAGSAMRTVSGRRSSKAAAPPPSAQWSRDVRSAILKKNHMDMDVNTPIEKHMMQSFSVGAHTSISIDLY